MSSKDPQLPHLHSPHILICKAERKLHVFDGEDLIKTYRISLGTVPVGDKIKEGDGRTPEGDFYIFTKNPESQFCLSLAISYPGIEAAVRGLSSGLISEEEYKVIREAAEAKKMPPQKTRLGGEIYIHGGGSDGDWTRGCIAMADRDIRELFEAIPIGTPIRIEA